MRKDMQSTPTVISTRQMTVALTFVLSVATVPAIAWGQGTDEQQQACTPDALKLCSDSIPDIPKTTACMKAHFSQLTPRCQAAFNDATGPKSKPDSKTAVRKAEPRTRTATRAERRMQERDEAPRSAARAERQAALPPRAEPDDVAAPRVEGYPPFPSPDAPVISSSAAAPGTPRGQIAEACRQGLIDAFTCRTTVPALLGE